MPETSPVLVPWANFYILAGSAAGALTGLMFVVITLVSADRSPSHQDGIATFSTPTVVHFGAALLVSALLSAPWRAVAFPAALVGIVGAYGAVYALRVMLRTRRLTTYKPDLEDWLWHTILPWLAYAAIVGGAIALPSRPPDALYAPAGGVLLLIFIGIHNAWDVVTYLAVGGNDEPSNAN